MSAAQALCYLSMVVLPDKAIPVMLDITKRIAMSHSYKTKMSMLEYVQVGCTGYLGGRIRYPA